MDCRGHGKTRPLGVEEKLNFNSFADDLLALMSYLKIPCAVVGGISMGAGVALNFALRFPDNLVGLILSRPAWLTSAKPNNLQLLANVADLIREYGAIQGRKQFEKSTEYGTMLQEAPAVAKSLIGHFEHPRAVETVVKLERMPGDVPNRIQTEWSTIGVPTLVQASRVDPVHPYEYATLLADKIPRAQLKELTSKSVDKDKHIRETKQYIGEFLRQFALKSG